MLHKLKRSGKKRLDRPAANMNEERGQDVLINNAKQST